MNEQPTISCRNLKKHFGKLLAVADVSLQIYPGICVLLGPNGAGKSTLTKLLTGLMLPDEGDIRIAGLRPADARRLMGVMPEDLGLFDLLTIKEHLELTGPVYGLSRDETEKRSFTLLQALGLEQAQDSFLNQCSHGTRKKTSLAMALLHAPRLLFLDEPFEGIDPVSASAIEQLLRAAAEGGATVFLTSHNLALAERISDRILVISAGAIVLDVEKHSLTGPLEALYLDLVQNPRFPEIHWLRSAQS